MSQVWRAHRGIVIRIAVGLVVAALLTWWAISAWPIPGFKWTATLTITAIVAMLFSLAGADLFRAPDNTRRREVGLALVTGAAFMISSGLVQASLDVSNFRWTVSVTNDLTGFDPEGRSLRGFNLTGKNLRGSSLQDVDLQSSNLRYADLKEAQLSRAKLNGANLYYASLMGAVLRGADFTSANLEGAELGDLTRLKSLAGARVHEETCWLIRTHNDSKPRRMQSPSRVKPTPDGLSAVEFLARAELVTEEAGRPLGHVCTEDEGGRDPAKSKGKQHRKDYVYICPSQPYLRRYEDLLPNKSSTSQDRLCQ